MIQEQRERERERERYREETSTVRRILGKRRGGDKRKPIELKYLNFVRLMCIRGSMEFKWLAIWEQ
jgi:hypothetical protein